MTKKNSTARKEFAWDTQERIGGYGDTKERHEVFICTLNGKTYIQDTKEVKTAKNGWKRTRGNTMPLENFKSLQDIFGRWETSNAFTDATPEQPKLVAKHQAKDTAPAPLRGRRISIQARIEENEHFEHLSQKRQDEVIAQAQAEHEENGMVSVGISKTNFVVVSGMGQIQAEKQIKETKGFSRSRITYIV